jgi:protein-L-isoaspartate(D-aspartate) O-methyltransferase
VAVEVRELQGIGMTSQRTRARMVERLRGKGIRDERVLEAMAAVPRHLFVEDALASRAYEDTALPIGFSQTISQPFIVARMIEAVLAEKPKNVLEVGTGCGYQAAVLAELARSVVTVERHAGLAEIARTRIERLGYENIEVVVGDGTAGWPERAPYDSIIVTAAAPHLPGPLLDQLAMTEGARIVIPIGSADDQDLIAFERVEDRLRDLNLGPVRFVPLIGQYGWQESEE